MELYHTHLASTCVLTDSLEGLSWGLGALQEPMAELPENACEQQSRLCATAKSSATCR